MDKKAIEIYTVGKHRMVQSFEFYKLCGFQRKNYTRWMMESVLYNGVPGSDYFPMPGNTVGRTIRFRLRYYLNIDFAISLCLLVKRREAVEIRKYLLESKGINMDGDKNILPDVSSSKIPFRNFPKPKED